MSGFNARCINIMNSLNDPYTVLGITRDTNLKDVKKAYFHLAKKYHPDMNPDDEKAKAMFMKIQTAYRIVEGDLDPEKRARAEAALREYEKEYDDGSGKTFTSRRGTKSTKDNS